MAALTFLGTAPGVPVPGRNQSAALLQAFGEYLLIDAGEPCSRGLRDLGVPFGAIRAVLITHAHSDHLGGLPMLLQSCWVEGRTEPLSIFLPQEIIQPLTRWLDAVYLPVGRLGFPIDFLEWSDGRTADVGGVRVTPHRTTHLDGLREQFDPGNMHRFHAFSLRIEWAGVRIVVSGDLGKPADLAPHLGSPIDVCVCELSHYPPDQLFAALAGQPIRRLILTHVGATERLNAAAWLRSAQRMLPQVEQIIDAEDGQTVEF